MVSFISQQTANSSRDTEFLFNKRSKIYKCMHVRKLCKFRFHVTIRSHLINTKIWTSLGSSKRIQKVPQNMVHLPKTTKLSSTITGLNCLLYFCRIRHKVVRQHNLENGWASHVSTVLYSLFTCKFFCMAHKNKI